MRPRMTLRGRLLAGCTAGVLAFLLLPAVSEAKPPGPMTKMGRGVKNIAVAFFDIPATIGRAAHEDSVWYAITFGIFEGIGNATTRAVSGFVEVVSSPFPRYDRPLYDRRLGESPLGRYKN
ncbi:MAG: exosortase system-associated protein, TIGR04073 family [Planctomycetes bacterium]|nr:exosortase system-associated protein, TIGR04073 family [Planctomycetota bacterium]